MELVLVFFTCFYAYPCSCQWFYYLHILQICLLQNFVNASSLLLYVEFLRAPCFWRETTYLLTLMLSGIFACIFKISLHDVYFLCDIINFLTALVAKVKLFIFCHCGMAIYLSCVCAYKKSKILILKVFRGLRVIVQ